MEGGRRGRRKRAGPAHFRWPLPDALINAAIAFVSFVTLSVWIPFHFLSEIDLFELVSKGGGGGGGGWKRRGGVAFPTSIERRIRIASNCSATGNYVQWKH